MFSTVEKFCSQNNPNYFNLFRLHVLIFYYQLFINFATIGYFVL